MKAKIPLNCPLNIVFNFLNINKIEHRPNKRTEQGIMSVSDFFESPIGQVISLYRFTQYLATDNKTQDKHHTSKMSWIGYTDVKKSSYWTFYFKGI